MLKIRNKDGAFEMSVGTIVVLVIGMTMLILGIVLVRTIFTGATGSVDVINDNVKAEINKLFSDSNKRLVINLPDNQVKIKKGQSFGIAFGVRNNIEGQAGSTTFSYSTAVAEVESGCGLSVSEADSYIRLGKEGSVELSPGGEPKTLRLVVEPTDAAPLCSVSYEIQVRTPDGNIYDSDRFIVDIVPA